MNKKRSAVFLDRDGTLIEDIGYLKDEKDLKLIEGASESIRNLNKHNIPAILVTNQSGVARGYFTEDTVKHINQALSSMLKQDNAYLDGIYYCPHHIKGSVEKYTKVCSCRKPNPDLIQQAVEDFKDMDISKSYVIGDKAIDIELARNAGCKGILVKTGYGSKVIDGTYDRFIKPDYIAQDINDAVNWILQDLNL